jgi:hypothetical protein
MGRFNGEPLPAVEFAPHACLALFLEVVFTDEYQNTYYTHMLTSNSYGLIFQAVI